jgi:hypothetical protein
MAIIGPDTLDECIAIATELREVAERIGDHEHVVDGYIQRVSARIVTGDVAGVIADLDAAEPLTRRLGQPALMWDVCGARAMVAIAVGNFADAARLIEEEDALGAQAVPSAKPVVHVQRYLLAELRGRVAEGAGEVRGLAAANPARPVFGCLEAYVDARLGRAREAELALSSIVVEEIPFDQEWLFAMSLLAETAVLVGDADVAAAVYRALEPWAALNVADIAEAVRGSVSRYLGLLAGSLGRRDDAARHFEDALAANERMGLRPWLALTQYDYARLVDSPDLRGQALAGFDELGMAAPA